MFGVLGLGERRLPARDQARTAAPIPHTTTQFLTSSLNINSL